MPAAQRGTFISEAQLFWTSGPRIRAGVSKESSGANALAFVKDVVTGEPGRGGDAGVAQLT
jgi:hypothetical protein